MARQTSKVRELLDQRGIKYQRFAARMGLTPVEFTRIDTGLKDVPDGYYERAAEVLDVPASWLRPESEPAEVVA
jgi:transcriptional regulator with XRE-family HTH domain